MAIYREVLAQKSAEACSPGRCSRASSRSVLRVLFNTRAQSAEGKAPVTQGDHLGASVSEHKDRRNVYNIETTGFGIFRQTHP